MTRTCASLIAAAVLLASVAGAADLTALGSWSEMLTASDLVSGAGSDLPNQIESSAGVTVLNVTNAPGDWSIRIRRGSGQWNPNFALFVKRTSSGSGSGSISGGESYIEVTGAESEIISGSEDRSNISLQFKLTGLASNVSAGTYLSSLIFTVQ